jgi:hypothetical protein
MTIDEFHCYDAEWRPLEALLPLGECGAFMYMGWLEVDGQRLHHYKHEVTRRYLFVTDDLKTYKYVGDYEYVPQARKRAIRLRGTERAETESTGRSRQGRVVRRGLSRNRAAGAHEGSNKFPLGPRAPGHSGVVGGVKHPS